MIFNKYALIALGALGALVSYLSTVDWSSMLPSSKAGAVVTLILVLKTVLASLMPPPSQKTIVADSQAGGLITHT